jgi:hypothetical protein
LLNNFNVAVVAGVGYGFASTPNFAVVSTNSGHANSRCDRESSLNQLDHQPPHKSALFAFIEFNQKRLRWVPAFAPFN